MSEADKEEMYTVLIVLVFIAGLALILMLTKYGLHLMDKPPELECRDGKLFEVTHEGNITIYDPTFDDCEVKE